VDTAVVAYDVKLADRLRELLAGESGVDEQLMFGGLAFLVSGHLAVSASSRGGLLLRVDPGKHDRLAASLGGHLRQVEEHAVSAEVRVDAATAEDLILMGPSAFHVDPDRLRAAVGQLAGPSAPVPVRLDARLSTWHVR